MWRRLRRRSFAPRRPFMFPEQMGIVLVTVLCVISGLVAIVWTLTH